MMSGIDEMLASIDAALTEPKPGPSFSWLVSAPMAMDEQPRQPERYVGGRYRGHYPLPWGEVVAAPPEPPEPVQTPPSASVSEPEPAPPPPPRAPDPYECRVDLDCGGCSCFSSAPCHHCMEHANADGTSIDPNDLRCPSCGQEVDMDSRERIEAHAVPDVPSLACESSGERVSVCGRD